MSDRLCDTQDGRHPYERCGAYLINLDRSSERLEAAIQHFSQIGLTFQRIVAIDASREDIASFPLDRAAFQRTHGRSTIRPGEIGCYFSHLKALRTFIDSGREFGIVFEDDAFPDSQLPEVLQALFQWADDWDMVTLFHFHRGGPVALRRTDNFSLAVHLGHISSAAAYLINKKAAHKLIQHLDVMRACIDHSLYESWRHGLKLRSVLPMPVQLTEQAHESTINIAAGGKPLAIFRLPTLANRTYVAIRIFLSGFGQIAEHLLKRKVS